MSENKDKDEKKVIEGQWTTGLYDCFSEDISTCCFTWFCPCVAFGRIAEILDKGETSQGLAGLMVVAMSHIGCGWYYASKYRAKLRNQYSLPEEPCADGAIHFFCCSCALSQEHRELKYRGLDPTLDFIWNLDKNDRYTIDSENNIIFLASGSPQTFDRGGKETWRKERRRL